MRRAAPLLMISALTTFGSGPALAQSTEAAPSAPAAAPAPPPPPSAPVAPTAEPELVPSPDVDLDRPPPPAPVPAAPPPPPADRWWESYEPRESHGGKAPLVVVGSSLAGIGALTLVAASLTWLTAYGESRDLEDECVNHYCVEGTPGGDTYERVQNLSKASAIMVGVSFPLMAGGAALALIGGQLHSGEDQLEVSIHATPGGVVVGGHF